MNKKELISEVAGRTGLTKINAAAAVDAVFEAIGDAVAAGDKVTVAGFGSFSSRVRQERACNLPVAGGKVVPAVRLPKFTAGKTLKDKIAK